MKINVKDNTTLYRVQLFGYMLIYLYIGDGIGFIKIFGKGFHWKDTTRHRLYFSERNGYRKALIIGKWRLSFLK